VVEPIGAERAGEGADERQEALDQLLARGGVPAAGVGDDIGRLVGSRGRSGVGPLQQHPRRLLVPPFQLRLEGFAFDRHRRRSCQKRWSPRPFG
jgi:hypothetical protein